MKRKNIYTLATLALLFGLAACTQEEPTDSLLPEGVEGTPIVFTATGLSNPTVTTFATGTRATVDDNWEEVDFVGIMIDGTVKKYTVEASSADNYASATLSSTDPHYWTSSSDITVTAWWPYNDYETEPPSVVVQADQSSLTNFEASDFISAENQTVNYDDPTLTFTHRTARVFVELTDYTDDLEYVKLMNLSTKDGNPDEIVPYMYNEEDFVYVALVAPQSIQKGTTFIICKVGGKTLIYNMEDDFEWKAGAEYIYTVSLEVASPDYSEEEDNP